MDTKTIETRHTGLELRADENKIGGYAAVFYDGSPKTEYVLWADCKERIGKDAFRSLIESDDDVIVSFNHDFVTLLGRRSAGTLNLSVDDVGLRWEVPYDREDPDHVRVARKIAKREVTGCSFAFRNAKETWSKEGKNRVRTLESFELVEFGPVITPAYKGTEVGLRCLNDAEEARKSLEYFETQEILKNIFSIPTI